MTDLHTHILPGMDDGSRSVSESVAMLREEARQGVETVVLTPHFYAWENSPRDFLLRRDAALERLRPALEAGMPRLLLGAEVQYFEGIARCQELPLLCTQDTDLLLLEMPFSPWSARAIEEVLELRARQKLRIILAHVERFAPYAPREAWTAFRRNGFLFQMNADYVNRWQTRSRALKRIRQGEIQLLASDCHSMGRRPPNLQTAWKHLGHLTQRLLSLP